MIIFANVLLDKQIITSETFTALLLMAVAQHHADRAGGNAHVDSFKRTAVKEGVRTRAECIVPDFSTELPQGQHTPLCRCEYAQTGKNPRHH